MVRKIEKVNENIRDHSLKVSQGTEDEVEEEERERIGGYEALIREKERLIRELELKIYQEDMIIKDLRNHNGRDKKIRKFLKTLIDHFREGSGEFI